MMRAMGVRRAGCALGVGLSALMALLNPAAAWACACGCGVFDVGAGAMMSTGEGGLAYVEYDTMDQNQNWHGSSPAPAARNTDKQIQTDFYTVGLLYMASREWGYHVQVPYWERTFKTAIDTGEAATIRFSGLGDIRVEGVYTGLSPDMSTGLTLGLKLPTGSYTQRATVVDRDTQIGSGSTDLLVGVYRLGALSQDNRWSWFAQAKLQSAFIAQDGYYPGNDFNAALGVYYNAGAVGPLSKLAPILQVKVSDRMPDSGTGATTDPTQPVGVNGGATPGSGYTRVFVAPGLEMEAGNFRAYAEVGVPVYTYTIGNELVASTLYKLVVSFLF